MINFTYRNKSKSAVMAMANKLKLGSSSDGYYRRHEIEYSYTLPYYVLELISHFNDLRNKRLEDIPFILETPYINRNSKEEFPPYKYEIENVRNKKFTDFIQ